MGLSAHVQWKRRAVEYTQKYRKKIYYVFWQAQRKIKSRISHQKTIFVAESDPSMRMLPDVGDQ